MDKWEEYSMIRKWMLDYYYLDEVINLKNILIKKFGFSPKNITLSSDIRGHKKKTKSTRKNIRRKVHKIVERAQSVDMLFLYIAGECRVTNTVE
jgi:hypothetical protein